MVIEDFGGQSLSPSLTKEKIELSQILKLGIKMAETISVIHNQNVIQSILIIGHNPGLEELANYLLTKNRITYCKTKIILDS